MVGVPAGEVADDVAVQDVYLVRVAPLPQVGAVHVAPECRLDARSVAELHLRHNNPCPSILRNFSIEK